MKQPPSCMLCCAPRLPSDHHRCGVADVFCGLGLLSSSSLLVALFSHTNLPRTAKVISTHSASQFVCKISQCDSCCSPRLSVPVCCVYFHTLIYSKAAAACVYTLLVLLSVFFYFFLFFGSRWLRLTHLSRSWLELTLFSSAVSSLSIFSLRRAGVQHEIERESTSK